VIFGARIDLIRTMVFAHIPSNILLCLVPLAPTACLAVVVCALRFGISQMDVPTRRSYTMAVLKPDERSAVSGVTTIARSVGASVSLSLTGLLPASACPVNVPPFRAGGLKTAYDLPLYRSFKHHAPAEEPAGKQRRGGTDPALRRCSARSDAAQSYGGCTSRLAISSRRRL
jgi:hypothetical protein